MKHETSRLSKIKVLTLLGIITFPFLLLNEVWFVPLANRESAITERVELNQAGEKMFKDSPWFGVGNGQSVFHMKQYLPTNTPTWNIQPIHNVWLLLIVEKGLLGLLISLSILYLFFRNILKKLQNPEVVLWLSIGSMLFVVSLFDHYLWTLLQGQIMLWAWVGWGLAIYDMQSQPELS
jgi:O-antigen ligase